MIPTLLLVGVVAGALLSRRLKLGAIAICAVVALWVTGLAVFGDVAGGRAMVEAALFAAANAALGFGVGFGAAHVVRRLRHRTAVQT